MNCLFIIGKNSVRSPPAEGLQLPDFLQGKLKWDGGEVFYGRVGVGFLTARQGYDGHGCHGRKKVLVFHTMVPLFMSAKDRDSEGIQRPRTWQ